MPEKVQLVFSDRYSATGRARPNPATVCRGQCEGMGCVPVNLTGRRRHGPNAAELYRRAEDKRAAEGKSEDGFYFVRCPACEGSGLRPSN